MKRVRVLVVEDSLTVRKHLCEVLAADEGIEIVAEAEDGRDAIHLCQALRPDVITMDMMLPVMSGLAATEYIMAHCPTPILVVSASFNRGELFKTYEALAAGAVDVLEKQRGDEPAGSWEQRFISVVKLVARIRVITHLRGRLGAPGGARQINRAAVHAETMSSLATRPSYQVIAIGASTGGPRAIVEVLRALPREVSLPVLVVLHISEPFGAAFADWLDGQTERRASYAEHGEPVAAAAGRIVMAPPQRHLLVRAGRLYLTADPERHSCRPSVDVLLESLAREYGAAAAACLLTGMGRDGAAGLLEIRKAGGLTIAQDEASCVVYGMPRAAAELDAATHVLSLADIAPALAAATSPSTQLTSGVKTG
jgi:two-component system, chemotaxis family, protein-glutamate methylesterase/glutaminase